MDDPRSHLPSVSLLLEEPDIQDLIRIHSRQLVMDAINEALGWYREHLKSGDAAPVQRDITAKIEFFLRGIERDSVRPVVNATGIILHTGLGRAVLPENAAKALGSLDRCCNLQIDLETGERGKRNAMIEKLLCKLTGAEAALIVNNNAAATYLILAALCREKEVIISRGQMIEIGGSYRLPDCILESGAILREVGTTNKTHLRDYEEALGENTGAILRCNPSNFRIIGFTSEVPIADLASLKKKQSVLVIDDLGCGALVNLECYGLPREPMIQESLAAGADLVCSSGDKLIGGPQAGIILGRKDLIQILKKHPLTRMLRVCKLTAIALEQTLRLFLEPESLFQKNPSLRMISMPPLKLRTRAQKIRRTILREKLPFQAEIREEESATGGGSLPHAVLKTFVIALSSPTLSAERLSSLFRQNEPPIITRIKNDQVLLDPRTIFEDEEKYIVQALKKIAGRSHDLQS
jgi:L-seryl-tRNA(Ser) seleniumtransferase